MIAEDSHEESLHEMVQSILNDSDNEEVLNNLKGLGYNNMTHYPLDDASTDNTNTNNNTDNGQYSRHPQIHDPSPNNSPKKKQYTFPPNEPISVNTSSKDDIPSIHDTQPLVPRTPKRKYVVEWRTVIFIRHGKSKWNAAEQNTASKIVAVGQGLLELYKHKKMKQHKIQRQKSNDAEILDAPLSREGIMEALNLCTYLRQYNTKKELHSYNDLFENTRNQINDIVSSLSNPSNTNDTEHNEHNEQDITSKLQLLLKQLDEYKIQSLIAQHPPQDDDNLRLPQPVPEVPRHSQVSISPNPNISKPINLPSIADEGNGVNAMNSTNSLNTATTNGSAIASPHRLSATEEIKEETDAITTDQDNNYIDLSRQRSPPFANLANLNDIMNGDNTNNNIKPPTVNTTINTRKVRSLSNQADDDEINNVDWSVASSPTFRDSAVGLDFSNPSINKANGKRYMPQIGDPQNPMTAKYVVDLLNGNEQKCGIVVSNLRRAMSTACICLRDRLQRRPYEKVQILGCLQEIGLNSDTRPLLFTKDAKPSLAKTERQSQLLKGVNMKQLYAERLSLKYYKGDASDKTAQQRLQEFALWLFAQRKYLHVVAIGHSHWFQSFFKAYLPEKITDDELPAKVRTAKIRNCGVVAFRIQKRYVPSKSKRHGRHISFEIAPQSITTLSFGLYQEPSTNHDKLRQEQEKKENSTSSNKDAGYLSSDKGEISDDEGKEPSVSASNSIAVNGGNNNNDVLQTPSITATAAVINNELPAEAMESPSKTPSLPQSSSTIATTQTPGILASIQDGQQTDNNHYYDDFLDINYKDDSQNNRPPIPDNKPPPIPPNDKTKPNNNNEKNFTSIFDDIIGDNDKSNDNDDKDVKNNNKEENDESDKDKDKDNGKKRGFPSLKKPKNLWSRAMNKFGGSPRTDNEKEKEQEKVKKGSNSSNSKERGDDANYTQQQHQPQQLSWDLANIQSDDDEQYIQ